MFFLDLTSLGAAFVSGCPFRSPFSAFIRFVFEKLITIPPQDPATFFKIAGQMTRAGSSGFDYRPRLLESLLPLLTLITSHNTHSTNEDSHLEIYIACLAQLSEFTDDKGTFWCLREDAKQHPMLDQKLINKLVELADSPHDFQGGLKDAAANVLYNYRLNTNGIPLENPITDESTVLEITADARNATMLNVTGNRSNNQDRGRLPAESHRLLGQTMHEVPVQSSEESEEMRWRRRGWLKR